MRVSKYKKLITARYFLQMVSSTGQTGTVRKFKVDASGGAE